MQITSSLFPYLFSTSFTSLHHSISQYFKFIQGHLCRSLFLSSIPAVTDYMPKYSTPTASSLSYCSSSLLFFLHLSYLYLVIYLFLLSLYLLYLSLSRPLTRNFIYFYFLSFVLFFSFLFYFLFLEQLRLGVISHAVTSVTT